LVELRKFDPNRNAKVAGDFDGDGKTDIAIFLVNNDLKKYGIYVWWESDKSVSPVPVIIEDDPSFLEVMGIALQRPAKLKTACGKGYWKCDKKENEKPEIELKSDAIDYFKVESASSIFYWDDSSNRFQRIWISD
jgi:hypothetical protein